MIECFMWQSIGFSVNNFKGKITQEIVIELTEQMNEWELYPRVHTGQAGWIYWYFLHVTDEEHRLKYQKKLEGMLAPFARVNEITKKPEITLVWGGSRSRLSAVMALNSFIQE